MQCRCHIAVDTIWCNNSNNNNDGDDSNNKNDNNCDKSS